MLIVKLINKINSQNFLFKAKFIYNNIINTSIKFLRLNISIIYIFYIKTKLIFILYLK